MKYRLSLTNYKVPFERFESKDGKRELVKGEEDLDVKEELRSILRMAGVYKDGVETCDGVDLANRITVCEEGFIDLEPKDTGLLERVFNKLISLPHNPTAGQISLGGDRYIELITRVFRPEEVS